MTCILTSHGKLRPVPALYLGVHLSSGGRCMVEQVCQFVGLRDNLIASCMDADFDVRGDQTSMGETRQ